MAPTKELYDTLELAFRYFNQYLFDDQLPPVLFTVQRKQKCMGYFAPDRWASPNGKNCHELAINPAYVSNNALIEVLQTLVHEMAHEWQHCFGTPSRNGYHNKEWADKMEAIGLMPSTTGRPGGKRTGQNMSDYPIPGGKFMQLCVKLVNNESFSLPWVDRQARVETPGDFVISIAELMEAADDADQEAIETLTTRVVELMPDSAVPVQPPKISMKTKYSCPSCEANLWGKSGLEVRCEPCDELFEENY